MKAPAKINLMLRVLRGRTDACTDARADGRHEIESVMQAIDFYDDVEVETSKLSAPPYEIICATEGADLPENEGNLAYRAACEFLKKYGFSLSVNIQITKRIPLAAGLAGGSSDAAAVLLALAKKHTPGVPLAELADLGVTLGADVPFQIYACAKANPSLGYADEAFGTAVAKGIGERLLPLYPAKKAYILLVNPGVFVSAAAAYALFDARTSVVILRRSRRSRCSIPRSPRPLRRPFFHCRLKSPEKSRRILRESAPNIARAQTPAVILRRSRRILCENAPKEARAQALSSALASGDEAEILSSLSNDLSPAVESAYPDVAALVGSMTSLCASLGGRAMMSGSGSTVFGIFFGEENARAAYGEASRVFPGMFRVLTETI